MPERLQKILAEGGFGSRRECESLIQEGRVEIDREVVTKLGTKVDPETQQIRVDGQRLKIATKKYFAVNKPRGVLSTSKDPSGRPRVIDLISTDQRIYTVGRLDKDSEGLIIVTNDGELANKLTHPKYGIEKTYLIQVEGHPTREQMESLVSGVYLAEGFVQIKHFQFKRKQKHTTEIEIVLDEGRNREVRRLLARIGHKVLFLRRIAVGSFVMEGIPFGGNRQLASEEIALLSVNPKRRGKAIKPQKKKHIGKLKNSSQDSTKKPTRKKVAKKKSVSKKGTSSRPSKRGGAATTFKKKAAKKSVGKKTAGKKVSRKKGPVSKSSKKSSSRSQASKRGAGRSAKKPTNRGGRRK